MLDEYSPYTYYYFLETNRLGFNQERYNTKIVNNGNQENMQESRENSVIGR
jgi:hypothetical protein